MVMEAGEAQSDLMQRFIAWQRRYLEALDQEPDYAKAYFLESLYAGERAMARRRQHGEQYAALYRDWFKALQVLHPTLPEPPPVVFELAVIGASELVAERIRLGHTGRLTETLLEPLLLLHLRLYGAESLRSA